MNAQSRCAKDFLNSLEILQRALLTALKSVQENRDGFVNAGEEYITPFEERVIRVRLLAYELEREFNRLEFSLATQAIRNVNQRVLSDWYSKR